MVFTGDLIFHGLTPLVMAGSVTAATLANVLADHERYFRFILATTASGRQDGLGPLEAAQRTDLGEFAHWADAERLLLNLHRAYADAEGRPFDMLAAFGDALTWNGGPLTTHVCCV